jgi:hypothetical protein
MIGRPHLINGAMVICSSCKLRPAAHSIGKRPKQLVASRFSESFKTNSLAEKNKKLFRPQRTFVSDHTEPIREQSNGGGVARRLELTKTRNQPRNEEAL